jgi:1-acyl-sn-glycerol-3-phosphate acyltransferase
VLVVVRSIVFNIVFYATLVIWLVAALPTLVMPYRAIVSVAKWWGRYNLFLLRAICGLSAEFRGLDRLPPGACLAAAKHQSAWETFALLWMFSDPAFILKRELQWLPFYGWFSMKARMIPVDRTAGVRGLRIMYERARREFARGRQIVIFPEGTRRPPGAEPAYKHGIAQLYAATGVPCVPIALNSGLYWPRRSMIRRPGTIVVEVLDPIPPGLSRHDFMLRLQNSIETATNRLVAEGEADLARAASTPPARSPGRL